MAGTCRHFGIRRQTFYRWQRRYDPQNLATLEERSHRPHRRRQATWSPLLADRVLALRLRYPRWGKGKLAVLLRQQKADRLDLDGRSYPHSAEAARPGSSKHPAVASPAAAALCAPAPMPSANPSNLRTVVAVKAVGHISEGSAVRSHRIPSGSPAASSAV